MGCFIVGSIVSVSGGSVLDGIFGRGTGGIFGGGAGSNFGGGIGGSFRYGAVCVFGGRSGFRFGRKCIRSNTGQQGGSVAGRNLIQRLGGRNVSGHDNRLVVGEHDGRSVGRATSAEADERDYGDRSGNTYRRGEEWNQP